MNFVSNVDKIYKDTKKKKTENYLFSWLTRRCQRSFKTKMQHLQNTLYAHF